MPRPSQLEYKRFDGLVEGSAATPTGTILSFSHTPLLRHRPGSPVVVLLHGWPQSRFMWRYVVPDLVGRDVTLFVPDLPGYGRSTLPTRSHAGKHDCATVGAAVLSAVRSIYGGEPELVLMGHDRGARAAQRLATDRPEANKIAGVMLMDIVPYETQWAAHADPRKAARYFHWTFLPVTELSVPMVKAYGGGRFCREMLARSAAASGAAARESLEADGAFDHYAAMYDQDHVIEGAAADYRAGASVDWAAQVEDRTAGRKLRTSTYVLFSEMNLGQMHDVPAVWDGWVEPGRDRESHGIGGAVGHFLPEEAPGWVLQHIVRFMDKLYGESRW